MLRPRSIALVGATDRSRWSQNTFDNLINRKYPGDVLSGQPPRRHRAWPQRRDVLRRGRRADRPRAADGADGGDRRGAGRSRRGRCAQRGHPDFGLCRDRPRRRRSPGAPRRAGAPARRIAARAELPGLRQLHRQRAAVDRRVPRTEQAWFDRRGDAERRQRQLHLQPGGAARDRPVAHGIDRQRGRSRLRRLHRPSGRSARGARDRAVRRDDPPCAKLRRGGTAGDRGGQADRGAEDRPVRSHRAFRAGAHRRAGRATTACSTASAASLASCVSNRSRTCCSPPM